MKRSVKREQFESTETLCDGSSERYRRIFQRVDEIFYSPSVGIKNELPTPTLCSKTCRQTVERNTVFGFCFHFRQERSNSFSLLVTEDSETVDIQTALKKRTMFHKE